MLRRGRVWIVRGYVLRTWELEDLYVMTGTERMDGWVYGAFFRFLQRLRCHV